jgi:hypothetical protein
LRRRLVDAVQRLPRIHHALAWTGKKPEQEDLHLHAEMFLEGNRSGIRSLEVDGEDGFFIVSDGRVIVGKTGEPGQSPFVGGCGVRHLAERMAPFQRARAHLEKQWGVPLPHHPYRIVLSNHLEDEGGLSWNLNHGIERTDSPVQWLGAKFLEGRSLTLDEVAGTVVLRGDRIEAKLRVADGLATEWKGHNPATGGTLHAVETATRWTPEEWRAEIDKHCATANLEDAMMRFETFIDWEPFRFLEQVLPHIPGDAASGRARLLEWVRVAFAADLEAQGLVPDAGGRSAEARQRRIEQRLGALEELLESALKWKGWESEPRAEAIGAAMAAARELAARPAPAPEAPK